MQPPMAYTVHSARAYGAYQITAQSGITCSLGTVGGGGRGARGVRAGFTLTFSQQIHYLLYHQTLASSQPALPLFLFLCLCR